LRETIFITIVSFLPFKDVVRTCILSKEWLKIWKSMRKIEFNELFFVNPLETDEIKEVQGRIFCLRWRQTNQHASSE